MQYKYIAVDIAVHKKCQKEKVNITQTGEGVQRSWLHELAHLDDVSSDSSFC